MSKSGNTAVIGAFVVGALVLAIIAVIVLGSGKFFSTKLQYVMFFEGSVKGLQTGSPVSFRGVRIGEVTDIALRFNPADQTLQIPVYVEIDPSRFSTVSETGVAPYENYQALVDKGMRAQLASQSFVTGMLMVTLDFYPDKPVRLVGADKNLREIPTIPSDMEQLQKTLADLPLEEMVDKLDKVIGGIESLVNSPDLTGGIAAIRRLVENTDKLVVDVRTELPSLTGSLKTTASAAESTLGAAEKTFADAGKTMESLAADFRDLVQSAQGTLAQAEKTLALKEGVPGQIAQSLLDSLAGARASLNTGEKALSELKGLVAGGSELGVQVTQTLAEFQALSRAIRALSDYLQRHPEALLRGKEGN
jgi:paraquat-inducible protein B